MCKTALKQYQEETDAGITKQVVGGRGEKRTGRKQENRNFLVEYKEKDNWWWYTRWRGKGQDDSQMQQKQL